MTQGQGQHQLNLTLEILTVASERATKSLEWFACRGTNEVWFAVVLDTIYL